MGLAANLLFMVVGTTILEGPLRATVASLFPQTSHFVILLRDCCITIIVAGGLSWCVQYNWCSRSAQWIWAACVLWLGVGILRYLYFISSASAMSAVWQHFSGLQCVYDHNLESCFDFFVFTFTFLRGAAYSGVAYFVIRRATRRDNSNQRFAVQP